MEDFGIQCDFDAVVECCEFLNRARFDEGMSKNDVIESVENRIHILMRRFMHKVIFPHAASRTWPITMESDAM